MDNARKPPPLHPLTRRRLEALVRRVGEERACKLLALPRSTFARALAGLPIRIATADVIGARLDGCDDDERRRREVP
jgi:hypothetical protein